MQNAGRIDNICIRRLIGCKKRLVGRVMQMTRAKHEAGCLKDYPAISDFDVVITEQKRFIEKLKDDKCLLEGRIALLEKERKTVLSVLEITQKNADEILRQAKMEAQTIIADARKEAERIKNIAGPIGEVLKTEETLCGILDLIRDLKIISEDSQMGKTLSKAAT
jgi:hypothetical protein